MTKETRKLPDGCREGVALCDCTWMKIGGPAQYFLEARSKEVMIDAVQWARASCIPFVVIGGGSNLLVADRGYEGLVIRAVDSSIAFNGARVTVGAGFNLGRLAARAAEHSLAGLEFAMGIPGTVGGAIRGNAGAFDGEMKDVVATVTVLTEGGTVVKRSRSELDFRYRHSRFKTNQEVILEAALELTHGDQAAIRALQRERLEYRRTHQPLEFPSLGSVFKNIPLSVFSPSLADRYGLEEASRNGLVPAGYLLDRFELKGTTIGRAQISEKHANFIINLGGATAEHVLMLMGIIQQKVRTALQGARLEPEIQFLGF